MAKTTTTRKSGANKSTPKKTVTKKSEEEIVEIKEEEKVEMAEVEEPVVEEVAEKEVIAEVSEASKDDEIKALKEQIAQMQANFNLMVAQAQMAQSQKVVVQKDEDEVTIGCRKVKGAGWGDPTIDPGEVRLRFKEEQSISVSDMKKFLRNHSIRKIFEDGICYFAEPEDYVLFNIKNYKDLSDENLKGILSEKDVNIIISNLDKLTDSKKNSSVINCVIFRICKMIMDNEISLDYYTRKGIEDYFNYEFDRGIMSLRISDDIRA